MKDQEKREFPANHSLQQALMTVVAELREEQLKNGCSIDLLPPPKEDGMVVIYVNWNS